MRSEDGVKRRAWRHQETIKKAIAMAVVFFSFGLAALVSVAAVQGFGQSEGAVPGNTMGNRYPDNSPTFPRPTRKQRQALMDHNFKKLKDHARELAELTKSLQADIEKSNENVLSLEIVRKAEQVEKLAKQIKDEAKGD